MIWLRGFLIALLLACLAGTIAVGEIVLFGQRSDAGAADAALVLGAAVMGATPSPVFEERIRHAVALYQAGQVKRLVMTGGLGPGDRLTEAEAARDWSIAHGVPAGDILIEPHSKTTEENLRLAAPLLAAAGLKRILIVSDPPHLRRALLIAGRLGLEAAPSPTPSSRYRGWRSWGEFVLRETYFMARCRLTPRC